MELISKLLNIDFASLLPELPKFMVYIRLLMVLALLAGPVAMLILAWLYLYKPTPEANYNFGYRTYYGMGSVEAWQFSQRIAGLIYGGLGALLAVAMLIVSLCFIGKTLLTVGLMAMICLIVQVVLLIAARITIALMCRKYFDKDGGRRMPAPRTAPRRNPAPRNRQRPRR